MNTQYTFDEREKSLKKNDGRMKKGHGQEEPRQPNLRGRRG